MSTDRNDGAITPSGGPHYRDAFECLYRVVRDGLRHGYFRCTVSSGITGHDRREMIIEAGKSHKFTIPADELPR